MALLDKIKELNPNQVQKVPKDVLDRVNRGRLNNRRYRSERDECLSMWRGDQFVYRNSEGLLISQSTTVGNKVGDKPRYRMRLPNNKLINAVATEVSYATQRVPSYDIEPSTIDPEDLDAARLARKVARFGYDKWNVGEVTKSVVTYAVVVGEGFAYPYWDSTQGTQLEGGVGTGELKIRVLSPNEVYWEPGIRFIESRWHVVEQARAIEEVYKMEGYLGGKLTPDASTVSTYGKNRPVQTNMVLVTEYLERPSPSNPAGRRIVSANERVIIPEEDYPCVEHYDGPVLHPLSYFLDPDNDRDMGPVKHAVPLQRIINDCGNRLLMWKNLALNPKWVAPEGSILTRPSEEPGSITYYRPTYGQQPTPVPVPPIPPELLQLKREAENDMDRLFAQNQLPNQVDTAGGTQALIERDNNRRAIFLSNLAEFHSRLMTHCLAIVQNYYTEPRLLKLRGRFGPELIQNFMGSMLQGQVDVRILPGSLAPQTKEQLTQTIMGFVQIGAVDPQKALIAIEHGTIDSLLEDYDLDETFQNFEISQMLGMVNLQGAGPPEARPFDDHLIHLATLNRWRKTPDYALASPMVKEAAELHAQQHQFFLDQEKQKAAMDAQQMAATNGMANAGAPQSIQAPQVGNPITG